MGMQEAVRSFFERYTDFHGRSSRGEYWWVYLAYILVGIAAMIVLSIIYAISDVLGIIAIVLLCMAALAILVPSIAISFRRLHDTNKSAWWLLLSLLPLGGLVILIFFILPGDKGENRFGPDPLNSAAEALPERLDGAGPATGPA